MTVKELLDRLAEFTGDETVLFEFEGGDASWAIEKVAEHHGFCVFSSKED